MKNTIKKLYRGLQILILVPFGLQIRRDGVMI